MARLRNKPKTIKNLPRGLPHHQTETKYPPKELDIGFIKDDEADNVTKKVETK